MTKRKASCLTPWLLFEEHLQSYGCHLSHNFFWSWYHKLQITKIKVIFLFNLVV